MSQTAHKERSSEPSRHKAKVSMPIACAARIWFSAVDAVEEPDVVTDVVFIRVSEVGVHRVAIKIDVRVGFCGFEPGVLHRHIVDGCWWLALFLARLSCPVVAVVTNCGDDLFARNQVRALARLFRNQS